MGYHAKMRFDLFSSTLGAINTRAAEHGGGSFCCKPGEEFLVMTGDMGVFFEGWGALTSAGVDAESGGSPMS